MTDSMLMYVNGLRMEVGSPAVDPEMTLLRFLRDEGLTGTKLGCGEGGCGACTVVVSKLDAATGEVMHRSVNACLAPVMSVDGCQVTTIEGIGSTKAKALHPVQERMAKAHGSQCGFCTPGIAMSMFAMLRNNTAESLTEHVVEESFDGNLCRCTGYRPILDAAKSFVAADKRAECPTHDSTSKRHSCSCSMAKEAPFDKPFDWSSMEESVDGEEHKDGSAPPFPQELRSYTPGSLVVDGTRSTWHRPTTLPALLAVKAKHPECKIVVGNTEIGIEVKFRQIHYPVFVTTSAVPELLRIEAFTCSDKPEYASLLQESSPHKEALARAGVAVVTETKQSVLVHESLKSMLTTDTEGGLTRDGGIMVGSAVTLGHLQSALKAVVKVLPESSTRGFTAALSMLKWFASTQIRNVASLAGNVATASPISDMNPLLIALSAKFVIVDAASGERRSVEAKNFFIAYRKVDLKPTELLVSIFIPMTQPFEFVRAYKQARRRDDDISIVNAVFRVVLTPDASNAWSIADVGAGFGGMAPKSVTAPSFVSEMRAKTFDESAIAAAQDLLAKDLPLPDDVPGGMSQYRRTLPLSFWIKFYIATCQDLAAEIGANGSDALPAAPSMDARDITGARSFVTNEHNVSHGEQDFEVHTFGDLRRGPMQGEEAGAPILDTAAVPHTDINGQQLIDVEKVGLAPGSNDSADPAQQARGPVGKPMKHRSAELQCTGEAQYVDDIPAPVGLLHGALVLSDRPVGTIKGIDASKALAEAGVVAFYSAADVPGSNILGPVFKDEEVFATTSVVQVGQPVGVIIAETAELAQRVASSLVKIEWDESDKTQALLSIEDAIAADSFHDMKHKLIQGDVEAAFNVPGAVVVEGEMRMGGQEHFYLETNATLAVPGEGADTMVLHTSTQNTMKAQNFAASACGMPAHKVVAKVKRMGGAFGGKETRSVFVSCAAAIAAKLLGKPIKIFLDRDVDMATTGQRHAFVAKYKASASPDGKLTGLHVKLYANMGSSFDLTGPVMDRALFHVDNAYKVPNVSAHGFLCFTNLPSNTAFRGFGGPQGLQLCETYMTHLANKLGMVPREFRRINLYGEGELTHFDQPVLNNPLQRMYEQITESADVEARELAIAEFNKKNKYVKKGLDVIPVKFGISFTAKFMNQGGALVHVYTDGTILVNHGGTEMGQGLHTKIMQVAARAFGVSADAVHIEDSSTDKVPNASPTAASMSSDLYGMATLGACEQIVARLVPVARRMRAAAGPVDPAATPVVANDDIAGAEYLCGFTFAQVIGSAYFDRVNLSAHSFYTVPDNMCGFDWDKDTKVNSERGCPFNYFTFGACVSEVELDVLTGDLRTVRSDVLMDLGRSLNPAIDVGQIEGALMQGIGLFTMEEFFWGDSDHKWVRPGHMFTKGPGAYKIPAFDDVPTDLRISLLKWSANPRAVHSSKAVGEPPLFLGSSVFWAAKRAVQAAREEAGLGSDDFFLDAPATSERLRMACADDITARFTGGMDGAKKFRALGSW